MGLLPLPMPIPIQLPIAVAVRALILKNENSFYEFSALALALLNVRLILRVVLFQMPFSLSAFSLDFYLALFYGQTNDSDYIRFRFLALFFRP